MDELWRQRKWKDRPKNLYPDVSCKDAPVPPAVPIPNCDCGNPAKVKQSNHPDTAARAYYLCGDHRDWEMCNFFQWIDGLEMFDPRILHFKQWRSTPYEKFKRWVPPPPNPPPMTAEEKKEASARRMANPPLCNCGVPAELNRMVKDSPYPLTFGCRNRTEGGYPLCDFSEYVYGPKSYWPEPVEKKAKEKVRLTAPERNCHCGVVANYGLVPSELGIGSYCGHMVGDDLGTRKCDFEYFYDKDEVEKEIFRRKKFGIHPQVLKSYIKSRKEKIRREAKERGYLPRSVRDKKDKWVAPLFEKWEKNKRNKTGSLAEQLRDKGKAVDEGPNNVDLEAMKQLVANLPIIVSDDDE
ncbi:unnamed protein product [Urochloa humidicola]